MAEKEVGMSVKQGLRKTFREMVQHVDLRVDLFQEHKVAVNPFTNRKVFYVHVTCASHGFLCFTHCSTSIIVLVEHGGGFLGNAKVPHDATDKQDHLPGIVHRHEFGLGGGSSHRGLESTLVCNHATSKSNYSSAK
jgi:hypothetical protein